MIYTFKSKASADLIMLEPAGNRVVAVLGKEGKKGIITFAECASAIAKLEAAIAEQENARAEQEAEAAASGSKLAAQSITLRTRVWPFIEMLKHAQKAEADVVWGV